MKTKGPERGKTCRLQVAPSLLSYRTFREAEPPQVKPHTAFRHGQREEELPMLRDTNLCSMPSWGRSVGACRAAGVREKGMGHSLPSSRRAALCLGGTYTGIATQNLGESGKRGAGNGLPPSALDVVLIVESPTSNSLSQFGKFRLQNQQHFNSIASAALLYNPSLSLYQTRSWPRSPSVVRK